MSTFLPDYLKEQQKKVQATAQNAAASAKSLYERNLNPLKYPQFSTGARTFIQVGGQPLTMAFEFNYKVTTEVEEIRTVDTSFPWDIAVGQVRIGGTLRRFVHPDTSPEEAGLFHTMQSIVHQPYIELLVQDANGAAPFFARGMFTEVQAGFQRGQVTVSSATFVGVAYQHWQYQGFKPYPEDNVLTKASNALKNIGKTAGRFGF